MDVGVGNDSWVGSSVRPFKSIHKALSVVSNRDTVYVRAGRYDNDPVGAMETFPLTSSATGISIIGIPSSGGSKPMVCAYYEDAVGTVFPYCGWNSGSGFKPVFDAGEGWTISGLRIDNEKYPKENGFAGPVSGCPGPWLAHQVVGIRVFDLGRNGVAPIGTVTIEDCVIDDNWAGIAILDQADGCPNEYTISRAVKIIDCVVRDHGPLNAVGSVPDEGHQGILLGTWETLTCTVTGTWMENNHDGLESGNWFPKNTTIVVDESTFFNNENGTEVAQGLLTVTNSTFERNEARGTGSGGVAPPSAGFGFRGQGVSSTSPPAGCATTQYTVPPTTLTVRNCLFTLNQQAVRLGGASTVSAIDFGTSDTVDPGGNVFTIQPTAPWNPTAPPGVANPALPSWATVDNRSYVCVWMDNATVPMLAVGNVWAYLTCTSAYNQGVCYAPGSFDNGTFHCYSGGVTIGGTGTAVNIDPGTGMPYHRPTVPTTPGGGVDETCLVGANQNRPLNFTVSATGLGIVVK